MGGGRPVCPPVRLPSGSHTESILPSAMDGQQHNGIAGKDQKGSSLAGALPGKVAIETGRNVWTIDHSDHERQTHPFAKAALTHSFGIVSACFFRLLTAKNTKAVLGLRKLAHCIGP